MTPEEQTQAPGGGLNRAAAGGFFTRFPTLTGKEGLSFKEGKRKIRLFV